MDETYNDESAHRDSIRFYAPLAMCASGPAYAQASVLNSSAAKRQMAANAVGGEEEKMREDEDGAVMFFGI